MGKTPRFRATSVSGQGESRRALHVSYPSSSPAGPLRANVLVWRYVARYRARSRLCIASMFSSNSCRASTVSATAATDVDEVLAGTAAHPIAATIVMTQTAGSFVDPIHRWRNVPESLTSTSAVGDHAP